ncbi:hypothetical protein CHUAL_007467 [Chamberlinius hualienensis]
MIKWICMMLIVIGNKEVTFANGDDDMKLVFVNFIFRHGIRNPISLFKDDPNNADFIGSLGSLLPLGKDREYQLGQWFRKRYDGFLSPYYNSKEIYIQSTDVNRCLESAQLFAAGLFPPTPNETWNNNLGQFWIPIPVHSMPIWMDPYYFDFARLFCPRYQQWLLMMQATPQFQRFYNSNLAIENLLYSEMNEGYENFSTIIDADDTLIIEIKLCGGVMTREIMYRMLNVITNGGDLKVYVNSAHDYTIIDILRAMDVFDYDYPVFSSAISIELYKNDQQEYFIQVLYKNSTNDEAYTLQFPNCNDKCPWQFVWDLISPYFVYDIREECKPMSPEQMKVMQLQTKAGQPVDRGD